MPMDSTSSPKDTLWQTGLKRKVQQSVVYKGLILLTEINTGLVGEKLEDLPNQQPPKKGRSSNTCIRQSRLQTYIGQMR
jgi:hypothetical protein